MVNGITAVVGLCISAALICKLLEKHSKEQAVMLSVAVCAAVIIFSAVCISPVISTVNSLFIECGMSVQYARIIFKALGICYITQFACDICKDCGENAVASVAEVAGKLALLLIALPLFENLTELVNSFF